MLLKEQVTPESLNRELGQIVKRLEVEKLDDASIFPQFFQIENTRRCNARCPFCAHGKWDMSVPDMPDRLFDKIVEEFQDYREWIRFVDIQRAGEPLLDPKIGSRIRRMKDIGIRFVTLSTNGSLLDESMGRTLLEAGIDEVMISIDSVEKQEYETLRRGLNFERVVSNIKGFFELRDREKPDTIIRVRGVACFDALLPENQQKIADFESHWAPHKRPQDRVYMKRLHTWGNEHQWDECKDGYEGELDYMPCIVPWSTLHVTTMGRVPLCGQDMDAKADMGDINVQSIAEVWQAPAFQRVRERHAAGRRNEISFCRSCRLYDPDYSIEQGFAKGFFKEVKPVSQPPSGKGGNP
ncbi:MAG: radical SAM protein [Desulfobacterales bacterium]|nr:radical SAM protein [Desulfobacterales bacterium]